MPDGNSLPYRFSRLLIGLVFLAPCAAWPDQSAIFEHSDGQVYAELEMNRASATRLNPVTVADTRVSVSIYRIDNRRPEDSSWWSPRHLFTWGTKPVPVPGDIELAAKTRPRLPDGSPGSRIMDYDLETCSDCSEQDLMVEMSDSGRKSVIAVGARAVVTFNGETRILSRCDGDCRGMNDAFRE